MQTGKYNITYNMKRKVFQSYMWFVYFVQIAVLMHVLFVKLIIHTKIIVQDELMC